MCRISTTEKWRNGKHSDPKKVRFYTRQTHICRYLCNDGDSVDDAAVGEFQPASQPKNLFFFSIFDCLLAALLSHDGRTGARRDASCWRHRSCRRCCFCSGRGKRESGLRQLVYIMCIIPCKRHKANRCMKNAKDEDISHNPRAREKRYVLCIAY